MSTEKTVDGVSSKSLIPHRDKLIIAMYEVLRQAKSPLHVKEIELRVADLLKLSAEVREIPHNRSYTKLGYELAWARTRAGSKGHLISKQKGYWQIAPSSPHINPPKA
jgi:Mrr N-terminal domain